MAKKPVDMSFGDAQRTIYKFVISRTIRGKKLADIRDDALDMAAGTDQFWVYDFDMLYRAMARNDMDYLLDALDSCIENVSERIADWYGNAWNFPPGYKPVTLRTIEAGRTSDAAMMKLLREIAPETLAKCKKRAREEAAEHDKELREKFKKELKDKVPTVVAHILKNSKSEWKWLFDYFQKKKNQTPGEVDCMLGSNAELKDILKCRTVTAFRKYVKKVQSADDYIETVINGAAESTVKDLVMQTWRNKYFNRAVRKALLVEYNKGVDF